MLSCSERAAKITFGIAGIGVNVCGCITDLLADIAVRVAGAVVCMSGGCAHFVADVAFGVKAVVVGVSFFGIARFFIANVAAGIACAGIFMLLISVKTANKREEHQRKGERKNK